MHASEASIECGAFSVPVHATFKSTKYQNCQAEEDMKRIGLNFLVILAWVLSFGFPTQTYCQQRTDRAKPPVRYTLTDLGTLGGTFSQAFGVNEKGWVVGYSTTEGDAALHAFLWHRGVMTDLGTLGGGDPVPSSLALSINDRGEIAGLSETSIADPLGENFCGDFLICLPVVWRGGVITTLPTLGGNNGVAIDINSRSEVVGRTETSQLDTACPPSFSVTPSLWEKGRVHELPTIPGDTHGNVNTINDKGEAGGFTFDCISGSFHPVLWQNGKATDITVADLGIEPDAINNRGEVTGTGGDANGIEHAFLWKNGVATILETLPDTAESHGNSINDKGQVAGQSCTANGDCTVFVWQNDVVRDLNALATPGSSLFAVDPGKINARGQIVGLAFTDAGDLHGFLATPCDQEDRKDEGCSTEPEISVNASPVRSRRTFSVPENLPPVLRQRLAHRNRRTGQLMK
jgi:probable HAF family extracellular repeat protein